MTPLDRAFTRAGRLTAYSALLIAAGGFSACGDGGGYTIALIDRYHALAAPAVAPPSTDAIDAYLDYSLGMGEGMRATAAVNESLKNFLVGRKVSYFRVGETAQPTAIDISSPAANFLDLANFRDRGSRLREVVDRIVAAPWRTAIFVTDFERILPGASQLLPGAPAPHPIDATAWAQSAFREWLSQGHRIDVFAHRYRKPDAWFGKPGGATLDNWIYTIVFTPAAVLADKQAAATSVLEYLRENSPKKNTADFQHFAYWADAFTVLTVDNPSQGNANTNMLVEDFAKGVGKPSHDFHVFKAKDLQEFAESSESADRRVFNGVRITSGVEFVGDLEYGLSVTDVTSALNSLQEATEQGAPEIEADKETGRVDTVANKPKPIRYIPGPAAAGVFSFVYNKETREIGVKLDPAFTGVSATTVYRLDIIVQRAVLADSKPADQVLSLNYTGGYRVNSLGESLRLASRDIVTGMAGRVLHTFYVQIEP
jgi:hypothetical protein